jgi:putative SOS response-associated peptidase YedK
MDAWVEILLHELNAVFRSTLTERKATAASGGPVEVALDGARHPRRVVQTRQLTDPLADSREKVDGESPTATKSTTFIARVEKIATAPSYREPPRSRLLVILTDGPYEWRRDARLRRSGIASARGGNWRQPTHAFWICPPPRP